MNTPRRIAAAVLAAASIVLSAITPATAGDTASRTVWVFGDSIAAGGWLADPSQGWVGQLTDAYPGTTVRNYAVGGMAFHECCTTKRVILDEVRDRFAAARANGDRLPDVVIVAAGTNDAIGHEVGAPAWSGRNIYYSEYAAAMVGNYLRQQGVPEVVWSTVGAFAASPPQSAYPGYVLAGWVPELMGRVSEFNGWLSRQYGAQVVNTEWVNVDWSCWCKGSPTYFLDGFHPNPTGHSRIAWALMRSGKL